jgi:hypothetical protein
MTSFNGFCLKSCTVIVAPEDEDNYDYDAVVNDSVR